MKSIILIFSLFIALCGFAQKSSVAYLESVGKGGTRVFAVEAPVKDTEIATADAKAKLKPAEVACYKVINAILFEGVDNYNQGEPLVTNTNDAFAKSLVNPKTKTFMTYCKETALENSPNNKEVYHYIVEVNHFNLLKLLNMRGSLAKDFQE